VETFPREHFEELEELDILQSVADMKSDSAKIDDRPPRHTGL